MQLVKRFLLPSCKLIFPYLFLDYLYYMSDFWSCIHDQITNCMQHTLKNNAETRSEMINPLKTSLLNIYPEREGWKLFNRYNWASKVFDFVLQKESNNQISRILVEFNFESNISVEHFNQLSDLAIKLQNDNSKIISKIMIVDDFAQICQDSEDIEIIPISSFINENLIHFTLSHTKLVA